MDGSRTGHCGWIRCLTKVAGDVVVQPRLQTSKILLRGPKNAREALWQGSYVPDSHTKPYVRSKERKFEKARGFKF